MVFARVADIKEDELPRRLANGPGVSFMALPTFIGPWQYIRCYRRLSILAKQALTQADVYILRIPGTVASVLWKYLMQNNLPYGVRVVGSSWDSLGKGTVRSIVRPFVRRISAAKQEMQCRNCVAAAYVTQKYLQQKYPTDSWSTEFSDIELPGDFFISRDKLIERFERLRNAAKGIRPFRICNVGSMSALYKAQDILIRAVAVCRARGMNIELTLIGDGKYQKEFIEKAGQLGIQNYVNFPGQVLPGQAIVEQLDSSDLFVLPSLTEGLPRALIEAMARGLPCIGSAVGGIPELLDPDDLVAPRDAQALAAKIESVIGNPSRLEKMAFRNLQTAQEYRLEEPHQRRIKFWKKLIDETNSRYAKKNISERRIQESGSN